MEDIAREKFLTIALVTCGAIFFTIYPLSLIWPSGWQWHSGHGQYYLQMICGVYAVLARISHAIFARSSRLARRFVRFSAGALLCGVG